MTWRKYSKEVRKALKKYGISIDEQTLYGYFEDGVPVRDAINDLIEFEDEPVGESYVLN